MTRPTSMPFLLISLLCVSTVRGAAPPDPKPAAEKAESAARELPTEPVVVKRDLEFEVSDEPYKAVFEDYDAKMLEQRYIARFTVTLAGDPEQGKSKRHEVVADLPVDIRTIANISPFQGPSVAQMLVKVPAEHRPAEEIAKWLKTAWYHHVSFYPVGGVFGGGMGGGFGGGMGGGFGGMGGAYTAAGRPVQQGHFQIQAPSVDGVERLTLAVIALFDYGRSVPLQKALIDLRGRYQAELAELRERAAELESAMAQAQKDLEAYKDVEDLDAATLADLTTQQRLITVDLAGVKARIEACEAILARLLKSSAPGSRIEQVETIKVTAEIEMVGLTARRDVIGEIVDRARKKRDLAVRLFEHQQARGLAAAQITNCQERIAACEELRKEAMPFQIEGKITIQPIDWQPSKRQ